MFEKSKEKIPKPIRLRLTRLKTLLLLSLNIVAILVFSFKTNIQSDITNAEYYKIVNLKLIISCIYIIILLIYGFIIRTSKPKKVMYTWSILYVISNIVLLILGILLVCIKSDTKIILEVCTHMFMMSIISFFPSLVIFPALIRFDALEIKKYKDDLNKK